MMKNWPTWVGILAVAAIVSFYFWPSDENQPTLPPAPTPAPTVVPAPVPEIKHPIETIEAESTAPDADLQLDQPLPELEQSDARVTELLAALIKQQQLERIFVLDHFVERFVVMIDNLPRPQLPATHRPLRKTPGDFLVTGSGDELTLDPANYKRYTPLIELLEQVDQAKVVAVYVRLYPLFQKAYEKLGYPDRYFNDRLIEVIDHLLTTPTVADPIRLVRPKYYYQYANPDLEALSAGQKAMIRIGPDNAARLKIVLKGYRQSLTGAVPRE